VFNSSILVTNTCLGDATQFSIPANPNLESIAWDFGDGTGSDQLSPTHTYNTAGDYIVNVTVTVGGSPITNEQIITIHEVPTAIPITNQVVNQCDDDNDQIYNFTFSTLSGLILGSQDPAIFEVKYFLTSQDAIDNSNAIDSSNYTNVSPTFDIYVRVSNKSNQSCYDLTNFTVNVFKRPAINTLTDFNVCDDNADGNATNGQTTSNLAQLNNGILGNQSPTDFSISYHLNQNDADLDSNPQPLLFYNTVPFRVTYMISINNAAIGLFVFSQKVSKARTIEYVVS